MSDDDLWEAFEASDPTREITDGDLDERLSTDRLLQSVRDEAKSRRVRRFPRKGRRIGLITASAVFVLSGTAAAISLIRSPVANTTELACFSSASLDSKGVVVKLTTDPLSTCDTLMRWPAASAGGARGMLCVLSDRSLGGFPRTRKADECEALGLVAYDGHVRDVPVAAFQEAVQHYFEAHHCDTLEAARAEVVRLLNRYGISDWRIRVTGLTGVGSCATLAVEPTKKTVGIVGIKF